MLHPCSTEPARNTMCSDVGAAVFGFITDWLAGTQRRATAEESILPFGCYLY